MVVVRGHASQTVFRFKDGEKFRFLNITLKYTDSVGPEEFSDFLCYRDVMIIKYVILMLKSKISFSK